MALQEIMKEKKSQKSFIQQIKNVLQYSPDPKRQCLPTTTVTLSTECVKF